MNYKIRREVIREGDKRTVHGRKWKIKNDQYKMGRINKE